MKLNMSDEKNKNSFTADQLEEIAVKLREKMEIPDSNFIDITELAEKMGLDVYEVDFEDQDLLAIFVNKEEEKYIYIDEDLDEGDKRFVISIQLAHIILNHHQAYKSEEYLADYKQPFKGCYTPEEYGAKSQAVLLATALLMPASIVLQVWSKFANGEVVADHFKVSKKVALMRLDNLGLI